MNALLAEKEPSHTRADQKLDILVIDDNVDLLDLVCTMLELEGHSVRAASRGEDGIAAANDRPPDVLLSDLGLPGMSGCEVAQRLRENDKTRSIRLIALSGYSDLQEQERAKRAGFEFFFAKPIAWDELRRFLHGKATEPLAQEG